MKFESGGLLSTADGSPSTVPYLELQTSFLGLLVPEQIFKKLKKGGYQYPPFFNASNDF